MSQNVLPSSCGTTCPHLKLPLALIKIIVHPKNIHDWIPSHWTFFIQLTHGIQVSYIMTSSNQSWQKSRNIIHLFLSPSPINSSTSHLTTTYITTSTYTCGQTDTLAFAHLNMTAHGKTSTQSNMNVSNVIQPFSIFPCHILQLHLRTT